jgi:CO dehydrogenase/acetyl-CoA synthase delta subunit
MPEEKKEGPSQPECCCGPKNHEIKYFCRVETSGSINSKQGDISIVKPNWSLGDYLGAIMVRMGFFRMNYAVKPGLYATGKPNASSPVFVSSNYKLSFDILRRDLAGVDGWILVLDTKGVNVWCAAGKGTFGTKEIVARVIATGLSEIVSHRNLIVPQLGAPGVSAFKVMLFSAFKVIYGPVRSADIGKFLFNGMCADEDMRTVHFGLKDRLVVSLLELVIAAKWALPLIAGIIIIYSLTSGGFSRIVLYKALFPSAALLLAVVSGTVLTAALLPYLPGRAFSVKGGVLGLVLALVMTMLLNGFSPTTIRSVSFIVFVSSLSAYLALNFTGSSTFTSLSGTKKEVKLSLPVIIVMQLFSIITYAVKG